MSSIPSLRINQIVEESVVDGPGFRLAVFTQGCPHKCPGCHNPQTHDFAGGEMMNADDILETLRANPLLTGLTLSGGEPFCQPAPCAWLAEQAHMLGKNVVTFTGYTYEQLRAMDDKDIDALLKATDILIDGPFILSERDLSLRFRGSRNQRMLTLEDGNVTT